MPFAILLQEKDAGPSTSYGLETGDGEPQGQTMPPEEAAKAEAVRHIVEQAAADRLTAQVVTPNVAAVERRAQQLRMTVLKAAEDLNALGPELVDALAADAELLARSISHPDLPGMAVAKLDAVRDTLREMRPPLAFALVSTSDPKAAIGRYTSPAIDSSIFAPIMDALIKGIRVGIGKAAFDFIHRELDLDPRPEVAGRLRPQPTAPQRLPLSVQPLGGRALALPPVASTSTRSKQLRKTTRAVLALLLPVLEDAGLAAAFCGYADHTMCQVEEGQDLCMNTLKLIRDGKLVWVEDMVLEADGTPRLLGGRQLRDAKNNLSGTAGGVQSCVRMREWIAKPPPTLPPGPGQQPAEVPQQQLVAWPACVPMVWASSVKTGFHVEKDEAFLRALLAAPALERVRPAMLAIVGDLLGTRYVWATLCAQRWRFLLDLQGAFLMLC
jgi:hypothetical protein